MSGGACQKAAQQANDVLAQQAKRDEDCGCGGGCAPGPAPGKRDGSRPKKGSNRRGPGCKNADCNACAEQADAVMNAVAGFSDGIPEFSFSDVQRVRLLAGFRPTVKPWASAPVPPPPPSEGSAGCGDCEQDFDVVCKANLDDGAIDPSAGAGYNAWTYDFSSGGCVAKLGCIDYSSMCVGLPEPAPVPDLTVCDMGDLGGLCAICNDRYANPAKGASASKSPWGYNPTSGQCESTVACGSESFVWSRAPAEVESYTKDQDPPMLAYCNTDDTGDDSGSCSIQVKARNIAVDWPLTMADAHHVAIVVRNSRGSFVQWEGGPAVVTEGESYDPTMWRTINVTRDTTRREPLMFHPTVEVSQNCSTQACFLRAMNWINESGMEYRFLLQNSNSVVYTMLLACGVTPVAPVPEYELPGWGNDLRNVPMFGLGLSFLFS